MKHATVLLVLQGGRADYVERATMPFLAGFSAESSTGTFASPPGFAQQTVIFTGRNPDTSGNFGAFAFDPEASPFRWTRRLGPLRAAIRPRRSLYPARRLIERATRSLTGVAHADPAWIPPRFLPFFRPCEDTQPVYEPGALGAPSLFDLCRRHGKRFRYLGPPVSANDEWIYHTLIKELRESQPYDLYVGIFNTPDRQGHRLGPQSEELRTTHLRVLDERLASIHAALRAGYDSWDLLVCADHGMAPVQRTVDPLAPLRSVDAKPGRDYVVFVHSTLAAFWYLTERGRTRIEAALAGLPGSRVVDEAERVRRRIPTDRRWGDRLVAALPGVRYDPDYFHARHTDVRGMHGYLDTAEEGPGFGLLASSRDRGMAARFGPRPLVDAFATLCDLLDLPAAPGHEGQSLLAASRPTRAPRPPTARTVAPLLAHG